MSLTVEEFHDEIIKIQDIIKSKGLNATVTGYLNFIGDELDLRMSASEDYDKNGYWRREISFAGGKTEAEDLLQKARVWAYGLSNEKDRGVEFMIQQLNKLVETLPKGQSEVVQRAWADIAKMLLDCAELLGKSGLPSPMSISDAEPKVIPAPVTLDDEIPL